TAARTRWPIRVDRRLAFDAAIPAIRFGFGSQRRREDSLVIPAGTSDFAGIDTGRTGRAAILRRLGSGLRAASAALLLARITNPTSAVRAPELVPALEPLKILERNVRKLSDLLPKCRDLVSSRVRDLIDTFVPDHLTPSDQILT